MSRFGWAEPLVDRTPEAATPQPWDCSLLWGESRHRASLVWREPQACKALKLRQRSSALTFYPQYETFLRECGLYTVVSLLGQSPCKELVTALLERWRPETNTFHLLQGEATITLEDVEVLTGLPTRGRPVSVGYDARAADVICQELLGATPPPTRFTGHQVKISWVKEQFDRLPAGASADVITCYARAYAWVLVGAVLLADRSGDLIPVHLLRLLCESGDAGSFSWGSAVLAWLYKAMGRAAFFTGTSQKGTGDIGGFTLLVQLWALERFPYSSWSTMAYANWTIRCCPSNVLAINNTCLYLPVRNVPSMIMTPAQCLKASMHGPNAQNTLLNILKLPAGLVRISYRVPGFVRQIAFRIVSMLLYDATQSPYSFSTARCLPNHAFLYEILRWYFSRMQSITVSTFNPGSLRTMCMIASEISVTSSWGWGPSIVDRSQMWPLLSCRIIQKPCLLLSVERILQGHVGSMHLMAHSFGLEVITLYL
ncbi:Protein MAIN-LIKE 2 [Linum perenne]